MKSSRSAIPLLVMSFLMLPRIGPAQVIGRLEGEVLEIGTLRPIVGARIQIVDLKLETQTDSLGAYRFPEVLIGQVRLRVEAPGYASVVHEMQVRAERLAVVRFRLAPITAVLRELVVTAARNQGQKSGASVAVIEANELGGDANRSARDMLAARVPGAEVLWTGGEVGSASRVLLRGIKSLTSTSDPLFFVDGIQVNPSSGGRIVRGRGGAVIGSTDILGLIDPFTIERIEVLRGPAAAAQFGPGATNGAILIYTKGRWANRR